MKKKQYALTFLSLFVVCSIKAQTWTAGGGNLTTTATKVGVGTTVPDQKFTVQDGNFALTSSAYPSDFGSAYYRYITAKTDYSALILGTNPDIIAKNSGTGPTIMMMGGSNGWRPGRISYFSYATPGGSHGNSIAQDFTNLGAGGHAVGMLSLHDYGGIAVASIGQMPVPWNNDFGLMVDRGILARKYLSGGAYVNLFEVKDIGGKAVAMIGDVPYPSTPNAYGLLVENGILTERVRVAIKGTPEWADYVFADDYQLMPIKQLERYIETENHLPDVPSAEDVVKEGIDLGEMQAKLLQKIEELTLYVIQQQKEIDSLKTKMRDAKKQ